MQSSVELITPAQAVEYLKTSQGNRPVSKSCVHSYADSIRKGKWMLNGVPIIFDYNGHLIDGHHRMHAVIAAAIPVQMAVVRDVQPEAFTTIDQGRHKDLSQLLAMQQVPHYVAVAAIVNGNDTLKNSGRLTANAGARAKGKGNDEFYHEYTRDEQGYQDIAAFSIELYQRGRILKPSMTGSFCYYLSHTGGYNLEFVKRFFEAVCSLETSGIKPADMLRDYIIRNDRSERRLDRTFVAALVCKSWNSYVTGKDVEVLKYDSNVEQYPRLILNTEYKIPIE